MRDLWAHRELLGLLVRRELKARYKDSALGFFWSLMRPLTLLLIYYFAIGKFLGGNTIEDYAVYIFSGLTIWMLFNEIIATGTTSIIANTGLVKKVYLPREVFPLSTTGSALFNFGIQLVILVAATFIVRHPPEWGTLGYFPLSLLLIVAFSLALALILSAANVYLRDVQHLVEIALMVLFWASPIVYPFTRVSESLPGWATEIYLANPVTLATLGFQQSFWTAGHSAIQASPTTSTDPTSSRFAAVPGDPIPAHFTERLLIATAISLVLLVIAQRIFSRLQSNFAQEL